MQVSFPASLPPSPPPLSSLTHSQVLALGLCRTGTVSMQAALNILGYSTYHGMDYAVEPLKHARWERAINAKFYNTGHPDTPAQLDDLSPAQLADQLAKFDDLLAEYSAVTDVPCSMFADDLVRLYPDAKVILTTRGDEQRWRESAMSLVETMYTWPMLVLRNVVEPLKGKPSPSPGREVSRPAISMLKLFMAYFRAKIRAELEANLLPTYRRHNAFVRELMREEPERFLEFRMEDGWEPLCTFLGKEVPEGVGFPWLNERVEMRKRILELQMNSLKKVVSPLREYYVHSLVVFAACFALFLYRR